MINIIKGYESTLPKQHPVGMTAEWPNGSNSDLFASSADWVSLNGDLNNPPVADGSKVIIADTDHLCGICGDRTWVWKSFSRGENPIFMDQYDDSYKLEGGGYDMNNPNDVSLRQNLGYVRYFSQRMNLKAMRPLGNLSSTSYCLANPAIIGAEYLVYSPAGGAVTVDISATSEELNIEWFNPKDGKLYQSSTIQGGGFTTLTPPFTGDAVLYLYANNTQPTLTPEPAQTPTSTSSPNLHFIWLPAIDKK